MFAVKKLICEEGDVMLDLYTAIVFLSSFVLIITAAGVITNRLISKNNKSEIVVLCLLIGIAFLGEWIGVETNGADASLIWIHKTAKLLEFCVAPAISVGASVQYVVGRGLMKGKAENTFNPQYNTTRAETAQILYRFIESNN